MSRSPYRNALERRGFKAEVIRFFCSSAVDCPRHEAFACLRFSPDLLLSGNTFFLL